MNVLDVGCGPGAITAGIAKIVGAEGLVVGVDRDQDALERARREYADVANLSFHTGDVLSLEFDRRFDIVTAARTLQWTDNPALAVAQMMKAAKPGGRVIVLDYNHENNAWLPDPPAEFRSFYAAFLKWRGSNGWNNRMAECLPDLFRAAGLSDVEVHVDDEVTTRGDPDFEEASAVWPHVVEVLGPRMVAAGFLTDDERLAAQRRYLEWVATELQRQTLELRTVEGTV